MLLTRYTNFRAQCTIRWCLGIIDKAIKNSKCKVKERKTDGILIDFYNFRITTFINILNQLFLVCNHRRNPCHSTICN